MKILIIHTMAIDYNGVTDCIVQYLKHMNREGMEATILSTLNYFRSLDAGWNG